jgi:hypothetical protein
LPWAASVTLLAPGPYAIDQTLRLDASAAPIRLAWDLRCLSDPGAPPLWQFSPPLRGGETSVTEHFIIPRSCFAQSWRLSGRTGTTQFAASLRLVKLVVRADVFGHLPAEPAAKRR